MRIIYDAVIPNERGASLKNFQVSETKETGKLPPKKIRPKAYIDNLSKRVQG